MVAGDYFLQAYDECKTSRSPDSCRQLVANMAPAVVKTYLVSYDLCLRGFPHPKCRRIFAPEGGGLPLWTIAAAFGVGILIGRRM
jgi:hypothetical protein